MVARCARASASTRPSTRPPLRSTGRPCCPRAFRSVADSLVSLDEDANTLAQVERAQRAACETRSNTESRYRLGDTSFYTTLTAGQQCENEQVKYISARATRFADTAALLDAMGDPQLVKDAQLAAK